jgi:hypothetical protein
MGKWSGNKMTGKFWPLCLQKNAYMRTRGMAMGIENTQLQDNDIDMYFEAPGLRKCVEE